MILTGSDRKKLRGLAHSLQPVVQIGQQGLTEKVLQEIDLALDAHELIKVRFLEFKEEKASMSGQVEERLKAHVVGVVGHVAIVYRQQSDPKKRKISF